jgi:hypothetical protein
VTGKEKDTVHQMRTEGLSCSAIATSLGISVNTIKSYCQRNKVILGEKKIKSTAHIEQSGSSNCKQCGKLILQSGRHRPRKFCSETCRRVWWKINSDYSQMSQLSICAHCGEKFMSRTDQRRRYCSHDCYITDRFGGNACEQRAV